MKYYIKKEKGISDRTVISRNMAGCRHIDYADMDSRVATGEFDCVELPDNRGEIKVISRGKIYPDYKVALAIWAGQIKIEDIEAVK